MNIKSIAIAALIAASSFSTSSATSILSPLNLAADGNSSYTTTIDSAGGFWGAFLGVFNAEGFHNVLIAFSGTGNGFDPALTDVTFNTETLPGAPESWFGFLTFNTSLQSVTFASTTGDKANDVVAVPGPEAGAGLGALLLGGLAVWASRRRNARDLETA